MVVMIWWVILVLIWFFVVGMKWGYEVIGLYLNFFYVIVWILFCIKIIFIFIIGKIDGDELIGFCFVGN